MGLVGDNFGSKETMAKLRGHSAIGHVRYATTGEVAMRNVQPLFFEIEFGGIAICHNGNLTNSYQLRKQLVRRGCLFNTTSDTEVINHLIATSEQSTIVDRMVDGLRQIEGAYSLAALTQNCVIGLRDPLGVRPLVVGRLADAWIIASETCALDIIDADFVRDVEPGEIVIADPDGLHSIKPFLKKPERFCIFEHIYFARPDSVIEGKSVYEARKSIGRELARESHVDADIVVPVPDSGVPAAIGYSQEASIPFELGIIRNHYVGRTFIEPTDQIRHLGVRLKHNANRNDLKGKRVILVDDSIVRGTTSTKIVEMVRNAGAREVHMRISSPPTTHPCFYGIATPEREQLLAARYDVDEMAKFIGVDTLAFISIEGLYRAMGEPARDPLAPRFCDACFTGDYPIPLVDAEDGKVSAQLSLLAPA
jgi:amidophosphoribosyltransferase